MTQSTQLIREKPLKHVSVRSDAYRTYLADRRIGWV